jgi:hypothetical protein
MDARKVEKQETRRERSRLRRDDSDNLLKSEDVYDIDHMIKKIV